MMRFLLFFLLSLTGPIAAELNVLGPRDVAVLYNRDDDTSRKLALFYAKARGVEADRLLGLSLPKKETITRGEYEETLRQPLVKTFIERGWWQMGQQTGGPRLPQRSLVKCLVVMRGVPLRISRSKPSEEEAKLKLQFGTNTEAAVDSELAMAGVSQLAIGGLLNNRYFKKDTPFKEAQLPFMLLVGRIDAPTVQICERMIRDAVEVEKDGLWGRAYIDFALRSGGYAQGEKWLEELTEASIDAGFPTIIDRQRNTLPTNYPMTEAAVYFGWYAHHRNGPFLHPKLKMKKGSVIVHLHSFSAAQLRNTKKNWSAAILSKGAAATVGNVYEPFLSATHHFNILHDRLLKGYTLVEAAWMAMPVTSWQNTVLGDPLYRPFARLNEKPRDYNSEREYKALRTAYLTWRDPDLRLRKLRSAAAKMKSGTIFEALGYEVLEIGKYDEALAFFDAAKLNFTIKADQLRQDLNKIEVFRRQNKTAQALAVVNQAAKEFSDLPETSSLTGLSNILNPPAPKPAKPKKK